MKSTDKLKNYLENYTREKYFTDRVLKIRKEIGIPKNGIEFPGSSFYDSEDFIRLNLSIKYKGYDYPTFPAKMTRLYRELLTPLPKIYQDQPVIAFFNIYILYNERQYEIFESIFRVNNTVAFIDFRNQYLEMGGRCDCGINWYVDYMDHTSDKYPVVIGISPYATQNEVIDLVKKQWCCIQDCMKDLVKYKHIDPFEKGKKVLTKIRQRKYTSRKIEDVVYANKELPLNDLIKIVKKKTGAIFDPGEIGKIRSLAIGRREKNRK